MECELRIISYLCAQNRNIARILINQIMFNKQNKEAQPITFHHYGRKGYSIFNSLKREVRIGVLTIATLSTATLEKVEAATPTQRPNIEDFADDEESMAEVTVTGTMAPLTQLQSARIVSVLTREDIQKAGAQSVNDLMKLATGVDVRQRGGFGVQTDISIDGGIFDQITLLLNGVNISNPHTGHLAADFPVSISDIERIEVLEGAASRVYGGTAFGGAINIVTHKDAQSNLTAGAEAGSWGTVQADGRVAWVTPRLVNRLSGGGGRSDGGTTNSDWRKGQIYYQGNFDHEDFSLNWQAGFSKKQYGANTFYSAAYPNQFERNERYLVSVGAETKGKFVFTPSVYWNRTYDNFELIRDSRTGENFHQADAYGVKIGGHFGWWGGRTAIGADIRQEGILSTSLGKDLEEKQYVMAHGGKDDDVYYTRQDDRTNISFNLEHNILLDHWTISAGVMASMSTSVDHKFRFYPGIDVAYRPSTNWKVYLSYNKGFRLPSFTELYYKSATHEGNKGLKPEESQSIQLGTTYTTSGIQATIRGFYHRGNDMIDWVMYSADDTYHSTAFNLDNMGVQAEMKMDFNRIFNKDTWLQTFTMGYTYIHQNRHDEQQIYKSNYALEYLRHKFVTSLSHKVFSKMSANWNLRWQDRMGSYVIYETSSETGKITATNRLQSYHPYATLDLKLQWTDKKYDLYVQGNNLTNHRYYDLGNIAQPGICILAGARLKLNL